MADAQNVPEEEVLEGEEAFPENINLHSSLPTQVAIEGSNEIWLFPRTSIEKEGNIQFKIVTGSDEFLDPYSIYMFCVTRILDEAGAEIPRANAAGTAASELSKVIPVNGINHAWFKNINVKLNGQIIASGDNMYMYRGDLENRLSYPKDVKEGILNLSGFQEEGEPFDDLIAADIDDWWHQPENVANVKKERANLLKRYMRSRGSTAMFTMGRLHSEIFDQPKLLPPNSVLDIELDRNPSPFLVLTKPNANNYYVKLEQCFLIARIAKMNKEITKEMEDMTFSGTSMLYPIRRVEMSYYSMGPNTTDMSKTNLLHNHILPRRIFVCMVKQSAFAGNKGQDPFNYDHFNARLFTLRIGGRNEPLPPLECNFGTGDYIKLIYALRKATGTLFNEVELGIDYNNFTSRNVIVGWDLTGSQLSAGEAFEIARQQQVDLELKLSRVINRVVNLIIYAEYDSEIEIDKNREIKVHLNA